ncbi:MAG: DUF1640 domain-containing protein [Nitrospirae bacterium]|nr:DUF1640 domain-containing protein [Nitrospirota bacterium]
MSVIAIPKPLRVIICEEATDALITVINKVDIESKNELATKSDIASLESRLSDRITRGEGEIKLLRWMVGFVLAVTMTLILKAFFKV